METILAAMLGGALMFLGGLGTGYTLAAWMTKYLSEQYREELAKLHKQIDKLTDRSNNG